jgi:hypothetical protein
MSSGTEYKALLEPCIQFVNMPWFSNKHMYFACEICTRLTLLPHSNGDLVVAHSSVVVLGLHLLVTCKCYITCMWTSTEWYSTI